MNSHDYTPSSEQLAQAGQLKGQLDRLLEALSKNPAAQAQIAGIKFLQQGLNRHLEMPRASGIPGFGPRPATPDQRLAAAPGLTLSILLGRPGPDTVSSGDQVMLLQLLLQQLGFQLSLSGNYDIGTIQAVRNFQLKAKLPVTGQVDSKTRAALNPRLDAWKKQLAAQLGKNSEALSLIDLQSRRKRKTGSLPELPDHASQVSERIYGQTPPAINQAPEIELIHRALRHLGHPVSLGERFDAQTYAGVRKFQASARLKVTGLVDAATYTALQAIDQLQQAAGSLQSSLLSQLREHALAMGFSDDALKWTLISLQIQAHFNQLQQALSPREAPLDELPAPEPPERPLLQHELGPIGQTGIVSQGLEVERLQEVLQVLGYEVKPQGHYDLQTLGEVRRYQQAQGIHPSGMVDLPTREAINQHLTRRYAAERFHEALIQRWRDYLLESGKPVSEARWQSVLSHCERLISLLATDDPTRLKALALPDRLSEDLSPEKAPELQVLLLQTLLQKAGFSLELSACYDAETSAHVRSFQTQHKLPMNGRVDARTRESLNQLLD